MYIGTPLDYLIIAIALIIITAIWNGLINKQMFKDTTPQQKQNTSDMWHTYGLFIRSLLILIMMMTYGWIGFFLGMIFGFLGYEKILNFSMGNKLNYRGGSRFDQFVGKYQLDWIVAALSIAGIITLSLI